jgi:hypothetical protein
VLDADGAVLATRRVPDGLDGVARLHALLADHAENPSEVTIGIELDRGLIVTALLEAGSRVLKIEPNATARFQERHSSSGGKSDSGDARVLADAARTDGHLLKPVTGSSGLADAVRVLTREHQTAIWERTRTTQRLRHALREYFPAVLYAFGDQHQTDALAILKTAAEPAAAARLSKSQIAAALRRGGRQRNVAKRAAEMQTALRTEQMQASPVVAGAYATVVAPVAHLLEVLNRQVQRIQADLEEHFVEHPDAAILLRFPGLGDVLGALVLGEFGDDPNRFINANARRDYAGTSPITRASGQYRGIFARPVRNRRLGDAFDRWALSTLRASPAAVRSTTHNARQAKATVKDSALSATISSDSSTAHSSTARSTARPTPGATSPSHSPLDTIRT